MLKWFHKTYKGGVTSDQFRCFFPAINTGQHLSDMVFRYIVEEQSSKSAISYFRTLDRDSSGTIGFVELMLALELVGANKQVLDLDSRLWKSGKVQLLRFQDEVTWAFKMFDVDNSGTIIVEEIHDSVQVRIQIDNNFIFIFYTSFQSVWKILDGIGDAIDGTVEEISDFLYQRLVLQGKTEVLYKKVLLLDFY